MNHLEWAIRYHERSEAYARSDNPLDAHGLAKTAALISIARSERGQWSELRRIRRLLGKLFSNNTARFNATVTLVSKDGGLPMPLPPFNPSETQDVQIVIAPTNRAGLPTTGPFAWTVNSPSLSPQPSADGKTCLLVTAAGDLDAIATVTDTVSGNTDTFPVQRTAPPPPDNLTINFNPSGSLVDKTV